MKLVKIKFFLSDNLMAPTTISGQLFAKAVAGRGYDVEVVNSYERKKQILDYADADMIIFQKKIYLGHTYEDIKHLKGKVKLVHIDDDFVGMNQEKYVRTLRISDLILVGNKIHAEKMKNYIDTPVEAITSISDFENYTYVPIEQKNNNPLIISWQQNLADAYVEDLKSISKPLCQIYDKYGIELRLYGWHEGKDYGFPDRRDLVKEVLPFAKYIPFKPYDEYLKSIMPEIASSDIGILPYIFKEERYGKSSFGLRRMMMMGLPMVVSDFGNNKEMIQDNRNGFLAKTEEEWYEKLEILVLDVNKRKEFGINGRRLIEEKYEYNQTVDIFINAISKIM